MDVQCTQNQGTTIIVPWQIVYTMNYYNVHKYYVKSKLF